MLVFVVVLIPTLGFTIIQIVLAMKGRRVVSSPDDVRTLMQANSTAFTQFFAAIFRKLRTDDVYPQPTIHGADADVAPRDQQQAIESAGGIGTRAFWFCLEPTEQAELARAADQRKYGAGFTLWRQNERADSVIVIRSGQTLILIGDAYGDKVIAVRTAGDIVGERAALREGQRSATVVTASPVWAYVISTSAFSRIVARHPHILEVLEDQIYGRLTEHPVTPTGHAELSFRGENCSICLVDIAAFTDPSRTDADRQSVRAALYEMLPAAFRAAGIPWLGCYREDRGDGALIIIPPSIPTSAVIDAAVTHLARRLYQHNERAGVGTQLALRVAVSVGPVVADQNGVSGRAIDQAARLIEAKTLRAQVKATSAELGLIISTFVYETAISPNLPQADLGRYRRVRFRVKGTKLTAWMCLCESGPSGHGCSSGPLPNRPAA